MYELVQGNFVGKLLANHETKWRPMHKCYIFPFGWQQALKDAILPLTDDNRTVSPHCRTAECLQFHFVLKHTARKQIVLHGKVQSYHIPLPTEGNPQGVAGRPSASQKNQATLRKRRRGKHPMKDANFATVVKAIWKVPLERIPAPTGESNWSKSDIASLLDGNFHSFTERSGSHRILFCFPCTKLMKIGRKRMETNFKVSRSFTPRLGTGSLRERIQRRWAVVQYQSAI